MGGVAIFDFDGTVIRGDSVVALLFYARRRRALSWAGLIRAAGTGIAYKLHWIDALTAKKRSHAFLTRMAQKDREALLREFAGTLAARAYPEALKQIRAHKAAGDTVLLCSASCSCYMQYVAPLISADILLCTPSAPDGCAEGPNCRGQEKVRRVKAWLAENRLSAEGITAAYGDSGSDAPILRFSAHPVLVNPKGKLKKLLPDAQRVIWK